MSRVAKSPIAVPASVDIKFDGRLATVKGGKGVLTLNVHDKVEVKQEDGQLLFSSKKDDDVQGWALAGTTRALFSNMVTGVTEGFQKKLELIGVGYRAKATGKVLNLTLGFSHPVDYEVPDGVSVETPT